jgi:hypothetical protein
VQTANLKVTSQSTIPTKVVTAAGGQPKLYKATPVVVEGSQAGAQHAFTIEEVIAFSEYINELLLNDADLKSVLPIKTPDQFFRIASEGLLFWYI